MTQPSSFTVAVMARETRDVLEIFTRHYAAHGAERVLIFFDGDAGPVANLASEVVQIIPCDAAFWRGAGIDPDSRPALDEKLGVVCQIAFGQCRSDWLLIVDADELLIAPVPLGTVLARLPQETEVARIPNGEAVWGPKDTFGAAFGCSYLRLPLPRKGRWRRALRLIYGARTSGLMEWGIVGHASGKQILRAGTRVDRITSHDSLRDGRPLGRWLPDLLPGDRTLIAHFDAVSVDRWTEKFRRRFSGESPSLEMRGPRAEQMHQIGAAAARSPEATARLCRDLYGLTRLQAAALFLTGHLRRFDRMV